MESLNRDMGWRFVMSDSISGSPQTEELEEAVRCWLAGGCECAVLTGRLAAESGEATAGLKGEGSEPGTALQNGREGMRDG